MLLHGVLDRLGIALLFCTVGIQKEGLLSLREALLRAFEQRLLEFGIINTGSKADAVKRCQIHRRRGGDVNQRDLVLFGDGVQQLFRVSVMLGIVNNGDFHTGSSLTFISIKIILYIIGRCKYAEEAYLVRKSIPEEHMKQELTAEEYLNRVMTTEVSDRCPMRRTLELLNGKWRTHIIYALCKSSTCRFGELKRAVPGITNTMLTNTMRDLEHLGIVHREQFNEIPPHVEYSLTEKGKALLPVFTELAKWGEAHLDEE